MLGHFLISNDNLSSSFSASSPFSAMLLQKNCSLCASEISTSEREKERRVKV